MNPDIDDFVQRATSAGEDIPQSLQLARAVGTQLPLPGQGSTGQRWAVLAALGRANLTAARVVEAHTDAIAILAESGQRGELDRAATYGVFAAESSGEQLRGDASESSGGAFQLSGVKQWCSLGSELDVGLVTARVDGGRRLFRVDLRQPTVTALPTSGWVARGLRTVTSTSLRFDATPADPIGDVDWYLTRPGFSWGGIGVAACWYGGARGLLDRLRKAAKEPLDPLLAVSIGEVDAELFAAQQALAHSAKAIDAGDAVGMAGALLALRVRAVVAAAAERVIRATGHALGPAPLAFENDHARRVADLELYLGQHHAERDLAALGQMSLTAPLTGLDR